MDILYKYLINLKGYLIVLVPVSLGIFFFIFFKRYIYISQKKGELNKSESSSIINLQILRTSSFEKIFLFILAVSLGFFKLDDKIESTIVSVIAIYLVFFIIRAAYRLNKFE
jgi:hypothetical protein